MSQAGAPPIHRKPLCELEKVFPLADTTSWQGMWLDPHCAVVQ